MTFGEFKKLNVPDETPLVIRAWNDVAYMAVDSATIVDACSGAAPGAPEILWFDPKDSRASGIAQQVLAIGLV